MTRRKMTKMILKKAWQRRSSKGTLALTTALAPDPTMTVAALAQRRRRMIRYIQMSSEYYGF